MPRRAICHSSGRLLWSRLSHWSLNICWYLLALKPFTELPLFNELFMGCWLVQLGSAGYYQITYVFRPDNVSLSLEIKVLLFVVQILAHATILVDSLAMKWKIGVVAQNARHIEKLLLHQCLPIRLDMAGERWAFTLSIGPLLVVMLGFHVVGAWNFNLVRFIITLALQLKVVQILETIMEANYRLRVLYDNIDLIGNANMLPHMKSQHFGESCAKEKSGRNAAIDEKAIRMLKLSYGELYAFVRYLNTCYGYSLLAIMTVYFIDFLSNSYMIILGVITQGRDNYVLFESIVNLLYVVLMLSIICRQCQLSGYYGRRIGCLIYKLVKPFGNKHYNDLVSQFYLQTIHQRFIITAKDFFNVNFNLFGSMVVAIVTYLVILVQFMFSEKTSAEKLLKQAATTTVAPTSMASPFTNQTN